MRASVCGACNLNTEEHELHGEATEQGYMDADRLRESTVFVRTIVGEVVNVVRTVQGSHVKSS